jgi:single-stranded DNA-binding protein
MTIRTRQSLSGFIGSDPQLSRTATGETRFYARVGQERARREQDGTYTQLDPAFTDLVMFRRSAERAYDQFRKGDNFIAEGRVRRYTQEVDGQPVDRECFVASRIGHDNNRTTYTVDRARPERSAAVDRDAPVRHRQERASGTGAPEHRTGPASAPPVTSTTPTPAGQVPTL